MRKKFVVSKNWTAASVDNDCSICFQTKFFSSIYSNDLSQVSLSTTILQISQLDFYLFSWVFLLRKKVGNWVYKMYILWQIRKAHEAQSWLVMEASWKMFFVNVKDRSLEGFSVVSILECENEQSICLFNGNI